MIDVNVADDDGWTPLIAAADIGLIEVIPQLIAKGANVNVQSNFGWTPILVASGGNHVDALEMLLSSDGILVNTSGTIKGWILSNKRPKDRWLERPSTRLPLAWLNHFSVQASRCVIPRVISR
jgi:ankyrin repeat protein